MNKNRIPMKLRLSLLFCIILAFLVVAPGAAFAAPGRLVLGGKAVVMVADTVYLFPAAKDRVMAVAGADQGLGSFLSELDPGFAAKPALDRAAGAETYAALKPDAIILKNSMRFSLGSQLTSLGLVQFYLDLETPEAFLADIEALGKFLGQEDRARDLIAWYRSRMDAVARAASGTQAKRVLLVQAAGSGGFEVPPASWMQTEIVRRSGGVPVWAGANPGSGWARVNPEQIAAWNPEIVFVVDYRADSRKAAAVFAATPGLSGVAAVRSGSVYGFPQDYYSWDQPDTRWILGLEWVSRTLTPEAWKPGTILQSAREFFAFMYGIDSRRFDSAIGPRLAGDIEPR